MTPDKTDADRRRQQRNRARAMRRRPTEAERKLWWHLRRRIPLAGTYFRRQVPLDRYIVDFACLGARLVIEVDGGGHARDEAARRDAARTRDLEALGFTVLRFANAQIHQEIESVIETIHARIAEQNPQTLPPV
jgi:very-short-patch-repair endonuclease